MTIHWIGWIEGIHAKMPCDISLIFKCALFTRDLLFFFLGGGGHTVNIFFTVFTLFGRNQIKHYAFYKKHLPSWWFLW